MKIIAALICFWNGLKSRNPICAVTVWKMFVVIRLWCRVTLIQSLNCSFFMHVGCLWYINNDKHHVRLSVTRCFREKLMLSGKSDFQPVSRIVLHPWSPFQLWSASLCCCMNHNRTWAPLITEPFLWLLDSFLVVVTAHLGGWISLIWAGPVHEHGTNTAEVRGLNTRSIYTSHVYTSCTVVQTAQSLTKCHLKTDQTPSNTHFTKYSEVWI